MHIKAMTFSLICVFALTGCVSREQADERLARGCAAAVEMFVDPGFKVKSIKRNVFKNASEFGRGYRKVEIYAVESDDWMDIDKTYSCVFAEEMGLLGMSHRASIYQVKVNDNTYGREGDKILGDLQTHMKLNETVERAMLR